MVMLVMSFFAWVAFIYFVIYKATGGNISNEEFFRNDDIPIEIKEVIPITIQLVQTPVIIGGNRAEGSKHEGTMDVW